MMKNDSWEQEMIAFLVQEKKAQKLFGVIPYKWLHELNFELELAKLVQVAATAALLCCMHFLEFGIQKG